MPKAKPNRPSSTTASRKRPNPQQAIAHIDATALYLNHLRDHIPPQNQAGHTLVQNLSKCLHSAAASLCYTPKPMPDHPGQTKLGDN